MSVSETRARLVTTLEEILGMQRQLVAAARNPRVQVPDLVAQVNSLERLDDQRDDLIEELQREASRGLREARPGRPIREAVLEALTELRWPQNAGFLEEYLWAAHQLKIDSRAFAPLRRDEKRAWDRAPGQRAYVAPALNADGTANPRWLTSSAWALERRIITGERGERLCDLQKILSLAGRPEAGEDLARPWRATDGLLEQYARKLLGTDPPPMPTSPEEHLAWRLRVKAVARDLVGQVRHDDEPARNQAADLLSGLPDRERTWGRGATA